ncbi:hypothetical protein F5887DRAFT_913519 [Amanita rubescens]|nr:hypothetical protein F5887DRAFT_913519 [Amanita rubescens]
MHLDRVPVSPLALHPEKGGPKNLPVVRVQVDDEENEEARKSAQRPRLVIIGGGWGAMGVLQNLHPGDYHVTVVSADTFTTFTPLLPSAAVGTVQVRSLVEPIRKIIARLHGHFVEGKAIDLVMSERLLEVQTVRSDGQNSNYYIPYDKLVVAVGSSSATHGVPGLENCFQLKTIQDAQKIRRRILDNFESASLPTTSPEERKRLLSFVICGGGPTGVETAARHQFPKICRQEVNIHVIQSREHILNTYSEAISKYAEAKFKRDGVNLITLARVSSVDPDKVIYTTKDSDGNIKKHEIRSNFTLWSTGIAMNPFTEKVTTYLPNQVHKKAIEVDAYLRVKGAPRGELYAVGDCATIETSFVDYFLELVDESDKDKNGKIDMGEWEFMVQKIKKRIPMADKHVERVKELFERFDTDADNSLSLNELLGIVATYKSPKTQTAQVASQEGKYVGKMLHEFAKKSETFQANEISAEMADELLGDPFRYHHLGSLAYIGRLSITGGLAAMYAWRSVYWSEQVSARTRALLMADWIVRQPKNNRCVGHSCLHGYRPSDDGSASVPGAVAGWGDSGKEVLTFGGKYVRRTVSKGVSIDISRTVKEARSREPTIARKQAPRDGEFGEGVSGEMTWRLLERYSRIAPRIKTTDMSTLAKLDIVAVSQY